MIPLPLLSRTDLGSLSSFGVGCRSGESDAFEDCFGRWRRHLRRVLREGAGSGLRSLTRCWPALCSAVSCPGCVSSSETSGSSYCGCVARLPSLTGDVRYRLSGLSVLSS